MSLKFGQFNPFKNSWERVYIPSDDFFSFSNEPFTYYENNEKKTIDKEDFVSGKQTPWNNLLRKIPHARHGGGEFIDIAHTKKVFLYNDSGMINYLLLNSFFNTIGEGTFAGLRLFYSVK